MRGRTRFILLLLTLTLAAGLAVPASAEVMTLGVWLRGIRIQEDGTAVQVPVSGSFRVLQGGIEMGIIEAGTDTLTLSEGAGVVLEPMAETFTGAWDLSGARTAVNWTDGNVTVPVLLQEARAQETGTAREETGSAASAGREETGKEGRETESPDSGLTEPETTPAPQEALRTPELNMTPVPTAEPTQAPDVGMLSASEESGTFRIKAFYDGNNNGECSVYEVGVAGIQVYLTDMEDRAVTGGTTGANGEITLPGLAPGSYRIRVSLPEKWGFSRRAKETGLNRSVMDFSSQAEQDSAPITVSAGETVERGVGLLKGVTVSGVCWLDENANGIMEKNEPRIAGAHVTLRGQKNGLEYETYSGADGSFRIVRVRAGFYDFIGYAPDGMMFTRYSKTGGKNRSVLTAEGKSKAARTLDLNDGFDEANQNIGYAWAGSVSGMVFLDANYNGMYDEGEAPMPGVKVTAIKQIKDEEIAVAYSGEDGRYVLTGLRGFTYKIRAVLPEDGSDFTRTVSDPAGNHFAAREGRRENFMKDVVLKDGEAREINVGAIYYGSVSGTVYMDDDFSATLSGGEKVVQDISVSLLDGDGRLLETRETGAKGTYSFTRLTPGKYSLQMTAQAGYAFTRKGEGNVMLNRTGGAGYTEVFEVPLGTDVIGMDAGMIRPASVRGAVFADRNDNGVRDADEKGLTGTTVRLMSEEGEAFSAEIGESGDFLFDAVMPGRYCLEYRLPETGVFARTGAGGNTVSGEEGTGRGEWFDVKTADNIAAPLCGGLTLGSIGGTAFADHDGSGTREGNDELLAGVRLTLTPSREDLEETTAVTGGDGAFLLEGLRPDRYTLTLTLPEGRVTSRLTGVTLPVISGRTTQTAELDLTMGKNWTDQQLGAVYPAKLRGRVWLDENNDGLLDPEEQTPEGYEIVLTDEDTGELFDTLRTGPDGGFETAGLVPGSFTVSFVLGGDMDAPADGDCTFAREDGRMVMTGVALQEGDVRDNLLLGLIRYTAMGGRVWIDRGSGAEDLAGAKILLLDGEKNTLRTAETAEDGAWRFTGLMPGTYYVRAELPEGVVAAEPDDERLDSGLISVATETEGRNAVTDPIGLRMGEDQLSLNIGSVLPGTIGDYCWLDENGNGYQDGGEFGVPHVKVELIRNGAAAAETETDQYGLYFFREVYPAVYTLKITAPAEVKPTVKKTDIPLISSSLNETDESTAWTDAFTVPSDSVNFNIDLGLALRKAGQYPPGYGEQETMDWSKTFTDKSADQ